MTLRPRSRPGALLRGVVAGLAALALTAGVAPAASAPAPRPWAAQPLVVLWGDHVARRAPNADAARIEAVAGRRPLTKVRTVLPVLGRRGSSDAWLRVRLPGRPNGHTGWISAARTRLTSTPWQIVVSLSARRVVVLRAGHVVREFAAIVGRHSTPDPGRKVLRRRGAAALSESLRGAVRAGDQRPLRRAARIRRRPWADRPPRHPELERLARHRGVTWLRPPRPARDRLAGEPDRRRRPALDRAAETRVSSPASGRRAMPRSERFAPDHILFTGRSPGHHNPGLRRI